MIFWKSKIFVLLALSICVFAEKEDDTANAFMEAAQTLFRNKDAIGDLGNVARAFMQPEAGKEVNVLADKYFFLANCASK